MIHLNRFGKGKQARPRIRLRILRGYGGYGVGAIISPPAGAAQILMAKKDQLGRPVVEVVDEQAAEVAPPIVAEPAVLAVALADDSPAPSKTSGKKGK